MNYLASPAAGGGLRPRRDDGPRPDHRAARHRQRRRAGLPRRHLADRQGRRRHRRRRPSPGTCTPAPTPTSSPATTAGRPSRCPAGDAFAWDAESTYVRKPPYFEGMTARAAAAAPTSPAPGCWRCSATRSRPTTSARPARSRSTPPPAATCRARRRAQGLQQLRQPPRQPRGHDPRHLRQHPAAQPAGARHRGRRDAPRTAEVTSLDLRGVARPTRPRAPRWSSWPARSTARAPRATGRPRAPRCSASAP